MLRESPEPRVQQQLHGSAMNAIMKALLLRAGEAD